MWTTKDSRQSAGGAGAWYAVAYELAAGPRAVTDEMRRQHPRGSDGRCDGPHGATRQEWPCATQWLANTADRIRDRR